LGNGLFNRSSKEITVSAVWSNIDIYGKHRVRDVWRQKDLGIFENNFSTKVHSHDIVLVRMFPINLKKEWNISGNKSDAEIYII